MAIPALNRCDGCGIVERAWRPLTNGRCELCQREKARGANMKPDTDGLPGRPYTPLLRR